MVRFKIVLFMLCLYKCHSQNQSSISYDKHYISNNDILHVNQDKFNLNIPFNHSITFFSNYTISELDLLMNQNYIESDIKNLYSFDLGLKVNHSLKNNWKSTLTFNPQVTNNELKNIDLDNFIFNTSLHFQKKLKNNSEIKFGIEYGTLIGKKSIYPTFEFKKNVSELVVLSVGFPKSSLSYLLNDKNHIQFDINYTSHYYAISQANSRYINLSMLEYESVALTGLEMSLRYKYIFYNKSAVNIAVGKSFFNEFKINESNNEITNFNFNNDFIISIGFKYNLNFK